MMAFEYGCFISFRHLDGIEEFVRRLAGDIKRDLDSQGIPHLKVFLDEDRIRAGDNFNMSIPTSLCKTAVMIVVYVPAYFNDQKPYCTKEFVAFFEHEQRRLAEITEKYPNYDLAKLHQVIPIVLRKNPAISLPAELNSRNLIDWSNTTALERPGRFSQTNEYIKAKRDICDKILLIYSQISHLESLTSCDQFASLPDEKHPLFQKLVQRQHPIFP